MATTAHSQPAAVRSPAATLRLTLFLTTLAILLLGAVEGYFGKTDSGDIYGSDAVQYLDISRALTAHDWHSALNPLWSQGYPAALSFVHAIFPQTPTGDWRTTRVANFLIFTFCWLCFLFLLSQLHRLRPLTRSAFLAAAAIFCSAQIALDQVSRVGPDQLLAAFFFVTCAMLLRFRAKPTSVSAALLGATLGVGFLVKAAFLPLGAVVLLTAAFTLRRSLGRLVPAAAVFAAIALTYGAALSHMVGHRTLGEAGSLNYAWHVNRLGKWVHWQGGADPADKAWPKPAFARFAQWQTDPPDFGTPIHPDLQPGPPNLYIFHAPVHATYAPYFDPAYFYAGYHHLFRPRYQILAFAKNSVDLLTVLAEQPLSYVFFLLLVLLISRRPLRTSATPPRSSAFRLAYSQPLTLTAIPAACGIALYLPVHLEGRYLSSFLAVLALVILEATSTLPPRRQRFATNWVIVAGAVSLLLSQHTIWSRALHGWSPRSNLEWRTADAVLAEHLPANAEVGMISWTPNLHADWASMAHLRITSEIATPTDEAAFYDLTPAQQQAVFTRFQKAGAQAVLTWDQPRTNPAAWQRLPGSTMYIHRFGASSAAHPAPSRQLSAPPP